jgi:hypothetical protein
MIVLFFMMMVMVMTTVVVVAVAVAVIVMIIMVRSRTSALAVFRHRNSLCALCLLCLQSGNFPGNRIMNGVRPNHEHPAIPWRVGYLQPIRDPIDDCSRPPGPSLNLLVEGSIPSGLTILRSRLLSIA